MTLQKACRKAAESNHDHLHDMLRRRELSFDEAIDHAKPRPDDGDFLDWTDRIDWRDGLLFAVGFAAVSWLFSIVLWGWM